jgi:hypothetical protein
VMRQGGYYSEAFKAKGGVTQGDIPPPTIFNIIVECVVRAWTWETSNNELATIDGVNVETELPAILYADDGLLASTNPGLMQEGLDHLVGLFNRVGLDFNTVKTKGMVCTPNPEKGHICNHAYKQRMSGDGSTYNARQKR